MAVRTFVVAGMSRFAVRRSVRQPAGLVVRRAISEHLEMRSLLAASITADPIHQQLPAPRAGDAVDAGRVVGFDLRDRVATIDPPTAAKPAGASAANASPGFNAPFAPVAAPNAQPSPTQPVNVPTEARSDEQGFIFSPDNRTAVGAGNMTAYPWRTIGRMWMKWPNGTESSATGSMIGPRDFLTAGHCVYSAADGGWATQIYFSPGQDGSAIVDPYNNYTDFKRSTNQYYGEAYATYLRSYTGWTSSGDWNYDMAVVTLDRNIGNFTGWMGYGYNDNNSFFQNRTMNTAGYPGDLTPNQYDMFNTSDLVTTVNTLNLQSNRIDIFPGQSGSPLWDYNGTDRYTYGVVSSEWSTNTGTPLYNQFTRINGDRFNNIEAYKAADGTATDRPDLTSYDEWYNSAFDSHGSSAVAGGAVSFSTYVRNNGTASAGSFNVNVYASTNNIISTGDTLLGSANISSLGAFSWTSRSISATVPAGLAAGTYYVGYVIDPGGTQAEYAEYNNARLMPGLLSVTAPATPDAYEPNDTLADATNLATLSGTRTLGGLSIHASGNDDYYRFVTAADGTLNVTLAFTHSQGDIDLQLLDASGTYLAGSGSTSDGESITYAATRGAVFYAYVYGYGGAVNPSYTMSLTGPAVAADRFEPNDSFAAARPWGALPAGTRIENDLTIHAADNGDYYAFTPTAGGDLTVSAAFRHVDGDVDIELLASDGSTITGSYGVSDGETFATPVSAGTSYVLHVIGYAGALNWDYDLSLGLVAAPAVTARQFAYASTPPLLAYAFSTAVAASLDAGDLTLTNLSTGTTVPASYITCNAAAGTFAFPGYTRGVLPDGNYRAVLHAAGVTDASGRPMSVDDSFDFFVLAGDANRDRVVNFSDLLILSQNYGQSGRTFAQGNFDYSTDGLVNFADLLLLSQRYGASLPALAATPPADGVLAATAKRKAGVAADVLA